MPSARYLRSMRLNHTSRVRPYIPTRGFPLSTALRRAGYRVPDEVLAREGRRLDAELRSALEKKQKDGV